jgi:CHAD domain-containing protein
MDGPHEVELKYVIADPDAVRHWLDTVSLPGLTSGSWRVRIDRDTYVDTASGDLAKAGYGARIRRRGGTSTLALKSGAPDVAGNDERDGDGDGKRAHAPMRREELEGPATGELDPNAWPESAARELLQDLVGKAELVPLFEIRQRRQVREVRDGNGARAEISLDHGDVRRGRRQAGTFEALEVEARGGDAEEAILEPLAKAIEESGLGTPDSRSKLEIASALVAALDDSNAGHKAYAALPKLPGVLPDDTLAEAGRKVLRLHLGRMLAMEAGTRSGSDPEDLHKMRVATRRMRAAWRVFDGAYRPSLQRRYVAELKEVATALGTVRDLDVQLDGLEAYRRGLPESGAEAMTPLVDAWRERRDAARSALAELLDSNEYGHFVDDYRSFTDKPGSGVKEPKPNEPSLVREAAGGRIWLAYEQVRAHDAALRWADAEGLHALRIDGKRLRYTLEFFREALPRLQVDRLIGTVTEMQDLLGEHNDADVASKAAREFLVAQGSRLPEASRQAVGHYVDSRIAEMAQIRRRVPALWRRMVGLTFRRALASAIASL